MATRRAGGIFFGSFLAVGAIQAVTGIIPSVPSVASAIPQTKPAASQQGEFTGNAGPIKPGSVPKERWEELINKWGNKCKALTPALLAAQLHQESMGFNMDVITGKLDSPAGAKGMAQFIDSTWNTNKVDGNGDGTYNKYDPEDAIPSAATYDCKVANSVSSVSGNKTDNMLAGYNAGSGAVKKYGGIPPYKETQDYVRIIKSKAGGYEQ